MCAHTLMVLQSGLKWGGDQQGRLREWMDPSTLTTPSQRTKQGSVILLQAAKRQPHASHLRWPTHRVLGQNKQVQSSGGDSAATHIRWTNWYATCNSCNPFSPISIHAFGACTALALTLYYESNEQHLIKKKRNYLNYRTFLVSRKTL